VADYCDIGQELRDEAGWLALTREERDRHEMHVAKRVAEHLMAALPPDEKAIERLMASGLALAQQMSWEVVASRFVLPGIEAACQRKDGIEIA
jgi:hypothetical protein